MGVDVGVVERSAAAPELERTPDLDPGAAPEPAAPAARASIPVQADRVEEVADRTLELPVTDVDPGPILEHRVGPDAVDDLAVAETPPVTPPRGRLPRGVVAQLLRSAVTLQAESLLRSAGALAGAWGGVLDRTGHLEQDVRDLVRLAENAIAAGARLPAGLDSGTGDPARPGSVVDGLLAGHEALARVLRELDSSGRDEDVSEPWRATVRSVLDRQEEELVLLRAVGASASLPPEEIYVRGVPPRG